MEKILISHNRHWIKKYSDLYPRDLYHELIKKIKLKHILALATSMLFKRLYLLVKYH